jgi:hypothetical protein
MPITPFLRDEMFDPDVIEAMRGAFYIVCARLELADVADIATEMVGRRIIEVGRTGEHDEAAIARIVLQQFNVSDER